MYIDDIHRLHVPIILYRSYPIGLMQVETLRIFAADQYFRMKFYRHSNIYKMTVQVYEYIFFFFVQNLIFCDFIDYFNGLIFYTTI